MAIPASFYLAYGFVKQQWNLNTKCKEKLSIYLINSRCKD